MEMGAKNKVETIRPEGEIYVCPSCNYPDGFHVSFRVADNPAETEIFLICPNCHSRFRLGWRVNLADSR